MSLAPTIRLNSGLQIPCIGLGVYQTARGLQTRSAVSDALRTGYRHVDTARIYGNEHDVGAAIRESGVPRAEVFVTTKLWNEDQGYDSALRAFDASRERLGLEYIDLYLLHWPVSGKRLESWKALERLLEERSVRAIGVSNFMVHHLDELLARANVVPAIDQIELSPFLQRRDVRALCEKHAIAIEAYSPLTRGARLGNPVVGALAKRVGRSPAQVLLRWGLQHGAIVLPKSTHTERIAENFAVFDFELSPDQMSALDGLEDGFVTGWDPKEQPWAVSNGHRNA